MCTSDITRMVDFYVEAFGFEQKYRWPAEPAEPVESELVLDGRELWFVSPGCSCHDSRLSVSGEPPSHMLCLEIDDVNAAVSRLRASGTPILKEPTDQPFEKRFAYVADPDGRPILLYSEISGDVSA
ncbi:MAG: VOC family protein [Pseudonocardiaceae bacterium]